jgi:hypothetical protein
MEQAITTRGQSFVCLIDGERFPFDGIADREAAYRAAKQHAQNLAYSLDMVACGEHRERTADEYRRMYEFGGNDRYIAVTLGKVGPLYRCVLCDAEFDGLALTREHIDEHNL